MSSSSSKVHLNYFICDEAIKNIFPTVTDKKSTVEKLGSKIRKV
ncbi:10551_t:CDS:1, partial [Funneliformis geosporum]